ncbi:hypothetical protein SAMN05216403_1192 [Nitrosospira multiformis ATCC 25196]|uniref:Uncharacterized protein n=1 Tax=Nitrosospira multiformis (strain ATCC 25196 / NCIMB 11849 / C 71) TaxID=323848 RepID=A0A1H5WE89_NITMU|nr:hypothetical protein [Nitrosospira multiformis]SEF97566.1 hypothetical protein SAMN05216403_1192 [Nitrosospira multiformis ATCC 25196]
MPKLVAQEWAGQCLAKTPGRARAHQWDQVARECPGHEARAEKLRRAGPGEQLARVAPEEQPGQVGPEEQLGQGAPGEQLGPAPLEGDQAGTKLQ